MNNTLETCKNTLLQGFSNIDLTAQPDEINFGEQGRLRSSAMALIERHNRHVRLLRGVEDLRNNAMHSAFNDLCNDDEQGDGFLEDGIYVGQDRERIPFSVFNRAAKDNPAAYIDFIENLKVAARETKALFLENNANLN